MSTLRNWGSEATYESKEWGISIATTNGEKCLHRRSFVAEGGGEVGQKNRCRIRDFKLVCNVTREKKSIVNMREQRSLYGWWREILRPWRPIGGFDCWPRHIDTASGCHGCKANNHRKESHIILGTCHFSYNKVLIFHKCIPTIKDFCLHI